MITKIKGHVDGVMMNEIHLNNLSIITGDNGSGKSVIIDTIRNISNITRNEKAIFSYMDSYTNYKFGEDEYFYRLNVLGYSNQNDVISSEWLEVNKINLMSRTMRYYDSLDKHLDFEPSENTSGLSMVNYKQHKKESVLYNFFKKAVYFDDNSIMTVVPSYKKNIISDLERCDVCISFIDSKEIISDKKVERISKLSRGKQILIRLVVLLNYMKEFKKSLLLIDDFGDGLDARTQVELTKLLEEYSAYFQIILTTRCERVVDSVSMNNIIYLNKKGDFINAKSYHNSKEEYNKFKLTGLSNFDFLNNYDI